MSTLIKAMFSYAQENRVPRYLRTPEYRKAVWGLEEGWTAFRETLTEGQSQTLDGLMSRELTIQQCQEEAVFCSALSMGLELGRL